MRARLVTALCILGPAVAVGAVAQSAGPNRLTVWLPGKPWVMEMNAPGFRSRENEMQKDGRRYFVAENAETNVILSVYLEEGKGPATAEGCKRGLRGRATSNLPFKRSGITFRESGAAQILEYSILEVDGVPQNQRNLFACLTKDNVFADVHLSKVFFKAWDQPLFDAILQSVRFPSRKPVANSVPIGNSLEYFQQGSRFFLARQYKEAIEPYSKALEIEKVTPTLDNNLWRVLVDNLGMSYGILLDSDHAQEVFAYGVSKDPAYPLFYYNLACVAADNSDVADAERNLKLAYKYRKHTMPGEPFPDPRGHDSFQLLLRNKELRAFVEALYAPPPESFLSYKVRLIPPCSSRRPPFLLDFAAFPLQTSSY